MAERRHRGPNPFEVAAGTLKEAFPEIAAIVVEVEQYSYSDVGDRGEHWRRRLNQNELGRFIPCDNPRCWKGGFDLQATLREMVGARTVEAERSAICRGSERSPKGRKVYADICGNHFKVRVQITYARDVQAGADGGTR